MALTGVLKADFSDFTAAVSAAETKLVSFQTGAGKVEGSLNRMASSLSGTRLISDATLLTEAVARVGGASTLTASEMARVNAKVGEAIEKFRALGQEAPAAMTALHTATLRVPPALDDVISSAGRAGGSIATLRDGVGQFDRSLAQVGISLGPLPAALTEIAAASGKAVAQIGFLGTAGLTTAAALGGWSLGRMIAEFTETDQIIGDATAKLLGWGDAAAEEAAAGANTLAIASQKAGREITSMDEAVKFLTASATANAAEIKALTAEGVDTLALASLKAGHDITKMGEAVKFLTASSTDNTAAILVQIEAFKRLREEGERVNQTTGGKLAADLAGPGFAKGADKQDEAMWADVERQQAHIKVLIQIGELRAEEAARIRTIAKELNVALTFDQQRLVTAQMQHALIAQQARKDEASTLDRMLKASGANPTIEDPVGDILAQAQKEVDALKRKGEIGADAEAAIWARANVEIAATVQGLGHVVDRTRDAVTEAQRLAASFGASATTIGGVDPRAPVQGESIFQSGKFAASRFTGGFTDPAPTGGGMQWGGGTTNVTMNGVIATERESLRRMISDLIMEGTRQGRAFSSAR